MIAFYEYVREKALWQPMENSPVRTIIGRCRQSFLTICVNTFISLDQNEAQSQRKNDEKRNNQKHRERWIRKKPHDFNSFIVYILIPFLSFLIIITGHKSLNRPHSIHGTGFDSEQHLSGYLIKDNIHFLDQNAKHRPVPKTKLISLYVHAKSSLLPRCLKPSPVIGCATCVDQRRLRILYSLHNSYNTSTDTCENDQRTCRLVRLKIS